MDLSYSEGDILKINKYELTYNLTKINVPLGSPIFLLNSTKVIGIHKKNENENYGELIYPLVHWVNYIGIYNEAQYEGEYFNGQFHGKGKYIFDNGSYYIEEWKNGKRSGNEKFYCKDNFLHFDGEYNNDEMVYGKHIYFHHEDSGYYIGQFKNSLKNGERKEYFGKGKILYEGDFINNEYNGKGKYIYDDGSYYIGEFKNNKMNGRGTIYDKNGNILKDGIYEDNEFIRSSD